MEVKPEKKPRLQAINGLRFFAAIYIVLFHHGGNGLSVFPEVVGKFFRYGYVSVSLFFILSGFVLAYNYLDAKPDSSIDTRRFWIARFARIYPLYLLALLFSAPAFIAKFAELGIIPSVITGISTITLLQAWTPWTATVWNTPAWAVSVEAFCYLVFPFLAVRLNKLTTKNIIILAGLLWVSATILPLINLGLLNPLFGAKSIWMTLIIYHPIAHLPQFAIGVCLGILFLRKSAKQINVPKYSRVYILTIVGAIATSILLLNTEFPYELLNNGLLAPLFCLIIWTLAYDRGVIASFLSLQFVCLLGEASYAIYLFQNPLLSFFKLIVEKATERGLINPGFFESLGFLLGYLLSLIVISVIALIFFENPARKYLISKLSNSKVVSKEYAKTR